jgi:hypothetical protein
VETIASSLSREDQARLRCFVFSHTLDG